MPTTSSAWKSKSLWPDIKATIAKSEDFIVFDLETTGLSSKNDRIIEIAAIKYTVDPEYRMTEKEVYHRYINPERELPEVIVELTGITDEMLAGEPTESECIDDIVNFFDGCILSGYNIDTFDIKFLNEMYGRHGRFLRIPGSVDGIKMARNRLVRGGDVEDYKLKTVGTYFGIDFTAHSAIEDARTTGKLIQLFLHEYYEEEQQEAKSEETSTPTSEGTLRPNIQQVSYWPGFKGFSRIYVNMDIGSVYFDIRSSIWRGKDIEVNQLDMVWLEQEAFRLTGSANEKDFSSFKGSVYA